MEASRSEYLREWRERNKETLNEKNKIYRNKNRAVLQEKQRAYRLLHRDRILKAKTEYRLKNKDKIKEYTKCSFEQRRGYVLGIKYGITVQEFETMAKSQCNKCGICGNVDKLVVDHCHSTNKIRGLLCTKCNKGIGLIGDTFGAIMKAATYLRYSV